MKVDNLVINNTIKSFEGMNEMTADVKQALEQRINLREYPGDRPVVISQSVVMRMCLLAGLADKTPRTSEEVSNISVQLTSSPYSSTFFTKQNIGQLVEALMKMRYHDVDADWKTPAVVSRVIAHEILRGRDLLMKEGGIDDWLRFSPLKGGGGVNDIPVLNLCIGNYGDGMPANLDINSRAIANTQILVAGTTGSGKSNLLAVLLHEMRTASSDTHYPVNFLLFDYKGEFSDPNNALWLSLFDTDSSAILNPMERL